jgi:putative ABC transport system substrate-binding protein
MDRRLFLLMALTGPLAVPLVAETASKMYRLGILTPGRCSAASAPTAASALPAVLREQGYVEGQNLVIERRCAEGKLDRLPELARELARLHLDAIFALSPVAIEAAKRATGTIPIVMLLTYSDPIELRFVASFAHPSGNVTGVVLAAEPTMAGKRLELLKEAIPRATRLAILTTGEAGSRTQVQWAEKAAASLGVKLIVVELRGVDYDNAFATMEAARAEGLVVVTSVLLGTDSARIIQRAGRHRLPAIHDWSEHAEAGSLMTYGGSLWGTTRRIAAYVDRIFKGASPAELPVERATTYHLVINLKTATALGLTIPPSLLARADQVIE